jgi:hypothetical protein
MMMNPKARAFAPAIVMIAGLALATPAAADQVVYFVNGKAMTVKKVEKGDRLTILEVDGGGRIGIPTEQIDRIEELVLSNPAPAVAAPPPVIPAAGIGPQAQPTAAVKTTASAAAAAPPTAAAPGAPVGPMIGGVATQPGGGLAGLQPLAVDGTEDDGPMRVTAPSAAPPRAAAASTPGTSPATGALAPPPGVRNNALMTGPGAPQARRFNARGGAYGRMRPPAVNYVLPQGQGGAAPATAPGAKPATAAQGTAAPPPPPAPEPAVADPVPETADPAPDSEGEADAPADPPAEDPPVDEGSPEN